MEQDIESKYSEQADNASESPVSTGESRITKPSKRIESSSILALATFVTAIAAVALALVAWWQGCQAEKELKMHLAESRPILALDIKCGPGLGAYKIKFIVHNSGMIPARLIHRGSQAWIDGKAQNPTELTDIDIILPGKSHIISSYDLPDGVLSSEAGFKYAMATLYEPSTGDDTRRWITDIWIAYSWEKIKFVTRKRDEVEVDSDIDRCDLKKLQPADWLSWQPLPLAK